MLGEKGNRWIVAVSFIVFVANLIFGQNRAGQMVSPAR